MPEVNTFAYVIRLVLFQKSTDTKVHYGIRDIKFVKSYTFYLDKYM